MQSRSFKQTFLCLCLLASVGQSLGDVIGVLHRSSVNIDKRRPLKFVPPIYLLKAFYIELL